MKRGHISRKRAEQRPIGTDIPNQSTGIWNFYMEIWKERPHVSEISGKPLGNTPKSWMFEHLLEQKKYPELRMEKGNVILCTFEEHEVKTLGHPLPKHRELINKAKKEFLK